MANNSGALAPDESDRITVPRRESSGECGDMQGKETPKTYVSSTSSKLLDMLPPDELIGESVTKDLKEIEDYLNKPKSEKIEKGKFSRESSKVFPAETPTLQEDAGFTKRGPNRFSRMVAPAADAAKPPRTSNYMRTASNIVKGLDIRVHCYVKVYYLTAVDTKNSNFECDFLVALDWYLPDLEKFQREHPKEKPDWDEYFHPKAEVDNVYGGDLAVVGGEAEPRLAGLNNPGWAKLTQRFRGSCQTYFSVRDFPFDQHLLQIVIKIRAGSSRAKCLITHPSEEFRGSRHDLNENADFLPDWKMNQWFGIEDPERADMYIFAIHVQRHMSYIGWNIIFIFLMLEVLGFTAFGVDAEDLGDRMSINLTLVLTAVAFKYVVKEELPNVPYLTILDKYILLGFALMSFQGLENLAAKLASQFMHQEAVIYIDLISAVITVFVLVAKNAWILYLYWRHTKPLTYEQLCSRYSQATDLEYQHTAPSMLYGYCVDRVTDPSATGNAKNE